MGAAKRNHETAAGWAYHDATKHSFQSVRDSVHFLDWPNKPLPFKIYTTLDRIELPRELPPLDMPALEAISRQAETTGEAIPDLKDLAQALYYSAGVTKIKQQPGARSCFARRRVRARSARSSYIWSAAICPIWKRASITSARMIFAAAVAAGRLSRRDCEGDCGEPSVTSAPVTIICAGTYWRNAWKYQARTYRHFGWDNGTMLANLLATATALNLPARCDGVC